MLFKHNLEKHKLLSGKVSVLLGIQVRQLVPTGKSSLAVSFCQIKIKYKFCVLIESYQLSLQYFSNRDRPSVVKYIVSKVCHLMES